MWFVFVVVVSVVMVVILGVVVFVVGFLVGFLMMGVMGFWLSVMRILFLISDWVLVIVDVGIGNLNLSVDLLDLFGVVGLFVIGIVYNFFDMMGGENNNLYNLVNGWVYNFFNVGGLFL